MANDGHPFDRKGVLALCLTNLSGKGDRIKDHHEKALDKDWIREENQRSLSELLKNPNLIQTFKKNEDSTTRDYAGRWFFELLQNIDDAIGGRDVSRYIGTKGLGFLSIFEFSQSPEIFSGPFAFKFSKQRTEEALMKMGLDTEYQGLIPNLSVPWPSTPDKEIASLLDNGYSTVIKLDLKPGSYRNVKEALSEIDHHFILFSQNIKNLVIKIKEKEKTIERLDHYIDGNSLNSKQKIILKISQNNKRLKSEEWIKWERNWESSQEIRKRSSCSFCLPFENGKCVPYNSETYVYNFFPTQELSSIFGLLHITFDLSRDRKKMQMHGDQNVTFDSKECSPENIRLVEMTEELIRQVIDDELVPADTVIKSFSRLNEFEKAVRLKGKPFVETQKRLIKFIKSYPFLPVFGGALVSCQKLLIWENNLLDCLIKTKKISDRSLGTKILESSFEILEDYGCKKITAEDVLEILAKEKIKNKTSLNRETISKTISQYFDKYPRYLSNTDLIKDILFIEDSAGGISCLNGHFFAVSTSIQMPSFCSTRYLSISCFKNLKRYFIDSENAHRSLLLNIEEKLIQSDEEVLEKQLISVLQDNHEAFWWEKNGIETLAYLYGCFLRYNKIFEENIEYFKPYLKILNLEKKSEWRDLDESYFSSNWLPTPHLNKWFNKYAEGDEYQILTYENFKKEIKKYKDLFSILTDGGFSKSSLRDFAEALGISKIPRLRKVLSLHDNYEDELWIAFQDKQRTLSLREGGWTEPESLVCDWKFSGLVEFFKEQELKDLLPNISLMLENSMECSTFYRGYRKKNYRAPYDGFNSFAHFQLCFTRSIKLSPSPLRPSGIFSPNECYISKNIDPVFPTIKKSKFEQLLKDPNKVNHLIKGLKVQRDFNPEDDMWCNWAEAIPNSYKDLASAGTSIEKLNAQVEAFYKQLLNSDYGTVSESTEIPIQSKENLNGAYGFKPLSDVIWNNSSLDDDIIVSALRNEELGLFILGKLSGVGEAKLERSFIQLTTDKLSFITEYEILEQSYTDDIILYFEQWWDILASLDHEFRKNNSSRQFNELKKNLILCDSLRVSIQRNNDVIHEESVPFFEDLSSTNGQDIGRIFVLNNENFENLLKYICNQFFKWEGKYSLCKELFDCNDEDQIKKILKDNNLNPKLVSNFKTLFSDIEEVKREAELIEERIPKEVKTPDMTEKEMLKKLISNTDEAINDENIPDANKASDNSDNSSTDPKVLSKHKKLSKPSSRANQQKSFGSRVSGHMRPRVGKEVVGRKYFDDEETPQNKKIGDAAEKTIFDDLKQRHGIQNLTLLGGNNKGYDIEYSKNGVSYFVEVKGLIGSWEDTDVLFSKAQFEKAQEASDQFSIFVVEFVGDKNFENITEINDPASFFTKMQLDHGWKNFSSNPDHLQPAVGRILVRGKNQSIISAVDRHGDLFRLTVGEETKKITFNSINMQIKERE